MGDTAAERMHAAVHKHGIMWTDLAKRTAEELHGDKAEADHQVARLIERKGCSIAVAVSIIGIITDRATNALGGNEQNATETDR